MNCMNKKDMTVHKNTDQFVEKYQIDGKQHHRCKWLGCDYVTNRSDSIQRHLRRHTGEKPYKCCYANCAYASVQSSSLKIHIRRHTGEKPYKCRFGDCDKSFTVLGTLLIHERTHTGVKPFKCQFDECGYATIERSKLSAHIRKNHGLNGVEDNQNNCINFSVENIVKTNQLIPINIFGSLSATPCENIQVEVDVPVFSADNQTSDTSNQLMSINSTENSIKKVAQYVDKRLIDGKVWYYCKYKDCNYDTIRSDCIVRHIRSHTGEKPYKCQYENCEYATVQRSALNQHMVWHTGEKPHKCHYQNCSYKSIKRNKLQTHIDKNHLTANPIVIESEAIDKDMKKIGKYVERKRLNWFECKWGNGCTYGTIRSDCIIRHMRTHTGEKPYKCRYENCNYATIQNSSLKKHESSKHLAVVKT